MLFTNNEIDIEKVLCLHLLAAHSFIKRHSAAGGTPYLDPRLRNVSTNILDRATSLSPKRYSMRSANSPSRSLLSTPLEQARKEFSSKKVLQKRPLSNERGSSRLLPTYMIDIKRPSYQDDDTDESSSDEEPWDLVSRDEVEIKKENFEEQDDIFTLNVTDTFEPKSSKIISKGEIVKEDGNVPLFVNKQIEQLVDSVIDILQDVNPEKVRQMVQLARQPMTLKKLLAKPEIQSFLEKLLGKPIISNWESFRVSPAKIVKIRGKCSGCDELPTNLSQLGSGEEEELMVVNLEIADTTISLERLVDEIRKNVLSETEKLKTPQHVQKYLVDEDPLTCTSWRNLYRQSCSSRRDSKANPTKSSLAQPTSHSQRDGSNTSHTARESEVNVEPHSTRVSKEADFIESKPNTPGGTGFTLASYIGFTNSDKLTPSGLLSWESMKPKIDEYMAKNKILKNKIFNQEKIKQKRATIHAKAPKLQTNNPFLMSKVKCPVCKDRPIVVPEYENAKKIFVRKFSKPTHFKGADNIEKSYKEFKDRFLNDDFFKKRGLESLIKNVTTSAQSAKEEERDKAGLQKDSYSARLKATNWDIIRFGQATPVSVARHQEQTKQLRDQVEQLILQKMTVAQRKLVFKKLTSLRASQREEETSHEIPFVSYVIPVLSKKSVSRLIDVLEGKAKDLAYLSIEKGGLGFSGYLNATSDISNLLAQGQIEGQKSKDKTINSQFTILDFEKLKVEIAQKETHKKVIKFLEKKI